MRVLYISHTGIGDNLGQSQVLPYVRGLARRGADVDLVSGELETLGKAEREEIAASVERDRIRWHPMTKVTRGSISIRLRESMRSVGLALASAIKRRPDIIHGRAYLGTAVGDVVAETARKAKLLFDCRGMLGDEYVDAGHWTTDRIEYRLLKRYERRLFHRADGIVTLTRALQRWLTDTGSIGSRPLTEVVPCCVDLERFHPVAETRERLREELGLGESFTILYSGSLGSWYLEPEMTLFASRVRSLVKNRRCVAVCFTPSDAGRLRASLETAGFPSADVIVRKIPPKEIADYLCVGDVGMSFIQSCFSKKGSSPTKVAEYLACGNVVVVNGDIGDQADLAEEKDSCVVLRDFSEAEIERAARRAIELAGNPREKILEATIDTARRHFGLEEVGVTRYSRLYERLLARR